MFGCAHARRLEDWKIGNPDNFLPTNHPSVAPHTVTLLGNLNFQLIDLKRKFPLQHVLGAARFASFSPAHIVILVWVEDIQKHKNLQLGMFLDWFFIYPGGLSWISTIIQNHHVDSRPAEQLVDPPESQLSSTESQFSSTWNKKLRSTGPVVLYPNTPWDWNIYTLKPTTPT